MEIEKEFLAHLKHNGEKITKLESCEEFQHFLISFQSSFSIFLLFDLFRETLSPSLSQKEKIERQETEEKQKEEREKWK